MKSINLKKVKKVKKKKKKKRKRKKVTKQKYKKNILRGITGGNIGIFCILQEKSSSSSPGCPLGYFHII